MPPQLNCPVWLPTLGLEANVGFGSPRGDDARAIVGDLTGAGSSEGRRRAPQDPKADQSAVLRFLDAEAKARAEAERMIDALAAQNWMSVLRPIELRRGHEGNAYCCR